MRNVGAGYLGAVVILPMRTTVVDGQLNSDGLLSQDSLT